MRTIGLLWEQRAEQFLASKGLSLVARNYTARCGEIDLIMCERDVLVFVEVRYRTHHRFSSAINSIQRCKQAKLKKCAALFLQHHSAWSEKPCRFDVIAYDSTGSREHPLWIRAAFD
ncbi:MAG: YraN family protein [Luminiphilus sp.]|jgi:putative endonuclease|nr:YraN family protein [Luminiphilus sp.]